MTRGSITTRCSFISATDFNWTSGTPSMRSCSSRFLRRPARIDSLLNVTRNRTARWPHSTRRSADVNNDWNGYGGIFDVEPKREKLTELEEKMGQGDFWNDRQKAEAVSREARELSDVIEPFDGLDRRLADLGELHEMSVSEGDDESLAELATDAAQLAGELDQMEFLAMLSDEDDSKDAIIEIHPGAGGTEATDWAEML
ncbi:MAG TPA: PCRF domain-containing protein, partial [Candidatus Handelsmanbacteria bacterium]|nr:PCRF domain-containing protein [Candidatus Handelsmanbacteria bacterium]